MPGQILNIRNIEDIEKVKEAILNNEDFVLGEVEPIKHIIKLDGGRFSHYDISYITSDVAKIIVTHQRNFEKLLKEIESKFEIKFTLQERELKFQLHQGCLEIFSDLFSKETIMSMDSNHKMWTLITIAGLIVGSIGVSSYISNLDNKVQSHEKIEMKKLESEDRKNERETTKEYFVGLLEINKSLSQNKIIQDSINNPKKETLAILKDDEVYKTVDNNILTKNDTNKFEYIPPIVPDIEEIVEETHTISNYYFKSEEKYFKLDGISKEINSLPMSAEKRIKIITKAEAQQPVKLKLKLIRDASTNKIKEAFILDYIE